jgi:hypothetical protein
MESGIIGALVGVAGLVIINIIMGAFTYGKLTERVIDHDRRISRLEGIVNHKE